MKTIISTDKAPSAIGTYSQAVKVKNTVYLSGQIPLVAETMEVIEGGFDSPWCPPTAGYKHISKIFKDIIITSFCCLF